MMIINFKISNKAMDSMLVAKELGNSNKSMYQNLREYLNSLYRTLEKDRSQSGHQKVQSQEESSHITSEI
jgi:hypothetical protein